MRTDRLAEVWRLSRLPKSWQCFPFEFFAVPGGPRGDLSLPSSLRHSYPCFAPCTLPSVWWVLLWVPTILGMDKMGNEMISEDMGTQKAGATWLWFLLNLFLVWSPKISPIPKVGHFEKAPISLGSWRWLLLAGEEVIIFVSGKRNRWLFLWLLTVVPVNLSRSMLASRLPQSQFTSPLSPVLI